MKLPRFSLRWLMVAVAVLSLVFFGESIRQRRAADQRRESYRGRAERYRFEAMRFRDWYEKWPTEGMHRWHSSVYAAIPALKLKWAIYFEELSRKYASAASRPWELAPPDPPPPEIITVYAD
jgi:hypothetical protein